MAEIVGVHGAFHELWGPNQVASRWLAALRDGLWHEGIEIADSQFTVAFYGDLFRADPAAGRPDDAELVELAEDSGLIDVLEAEYGPGGLEVLAEAIGLKLLRRLVDQIVRYFAEPETRTAVQARLEDRVTNETRVIVAHSMGTLVAYEALCAHPEWPVTAFITVGSPLGGDYVFDNLEPRPVDGRGVWPESLELWANVASVGDRTVNEPHLANRFWGGRDRLACRQRPSSP